MNGLAYLCATHPQLVDDAIASFERIIAASDRIGRDLEAIQARAHARLDELSALGLPNDIRTPVNPVSQTTGD